MEAGRAQKARLGKFFSEAAAGWDEAILEDPVARSADFVGYAGVMGHLALATVGSMVFDDLPGQLGEVFSEEPGIGAELGGEIGQAWGTGGRVAKKTPGPSFEG